MSESVYKIIEVVGTSKNSWEDASNKAVKAAGLSVRDLRIAEIVKLDMVIENGTIALFRARVSLSFKYETEAKSKSKGKKAKGK